MGKPTGFMEVDREGTSLRPVEERVKDWDMVYKAPDPAKVTRQASRCMDCGVPFCNSSCPLGNVIPDWNDLVYRDQWQAAIDRLHSTNNFPEFTGLVCPAPCEASCVLALQGNAVTIKQIEWSIVERAWREGWIRPEPPSQETGKSVAVVGSGPAGLAAAQQLRRAGHKVTVFEREPEVGGLLRYGIPDFKLAKWIIDRRMEQLKAEGVDFRTGVQVGDDISAAELREGFDAVLLACGSEKPRDLEIPGRDLRGIHFAMDFLRAQNRRLAGLPLRPEEDWTVEGEDVIVIGGGDTGSDCVGTCHRQGARSVTSLEVMVQPPDRRDPSTPWPQWPLMMRSSSSHQEGGVREFGALTQRFSGEGGRVKALHAVRVTLHEGEGGARRLEPIPGSDFALPCDRVLLAVGYVHPIHDALIRELGVALDGRGNVAASPSRFATSVPGVFAAGDVRRGQSLVVWAQWEGREAARAIDQHLTGSARLPSRDAHA